MPPKPRQASRGVKNSAAYRTGLSRYLRITCYRCMRTVKHCPALGADVTDDAANAEFELTADDLDDFGKVYEGLRGVPGIKVTAVPAPSVPGEQGGAVDVLLVALSSGAITAFLQIIKVIAESRGPKFSLKVRQGRNKLEVNADNVNDVLPALRDLLDRS